MDKKCKRPVFKRVKINKNLLIKYYVIEEKTLKDVAILCNCSYTTVKNRLKKHGIPLRTKSECYKLRMEDLTNKKFNRLIVIKYLYSKNKKPHWLCKCDCGNEVISNSSMLRSGDSQSCGCYNREISSKIHSGKNNKGWTGYEEISGTFWYDLQQSALKRNIKFDITIEQIWDLFLKQNRKCSLSGLDIRFSPNLKKQRELGTASLDRIDSNKPYIIDNIQWVHKHVNNMKQWYNQDYFIIMCKTIGDYNVSKQKSL